MIESLRALVKKKPTPPPSPKKNNPPKKETQNFKNHLDSLKYLVGRHTRRVPLFFLLLLVKLKVVYGHNVGESFILLHQGQNEKSNCALQSYENVNLTNHFLYKCKSLELFNLKYMECGSDGTCKYNWVLYEKQF